MTYGEIQKYYRDGKFEESRGFSVCFYVFFAIAVVALIVVPFFILQTVPVLQQSMYPTIHGGKENGALEDKVGLSMLSGYGHGDIVVFQRDEGAGPKRLVKRVLALPGDKIRLALRDGEYAVKIETGPADGRVQYWLDEPYLNPENTTYKTFNNSGALVDAMKIGWLELGPDEVFVAGDNRESSYDSFSFGPIETKQIEGKVVCIYTKCASFLFLDIYKTNGTGHAVTLEEATAQ